MSKQQIYLSITVTLLTLMHGAVLDGFSLGSASFATGQISQVDDQEWKLERGGLPTEELYLTGRDETSVYLCDKEKEYNVQIDYSGGKIMINSNKRFDITDARSGPVNVRNLGGLRYAHGRFEQVEFKKWMWNNRLSRSSDPLIETGRSASSVLLTSMDGAMRVQLNFERKIMIFSADGRTWYDAFRLKGSKYSRIAYRLRCWDGSEAPWSHNGASLVFWTVMQSSLTGFRITFDASSSVAWRLFRSKRSPLDFYAAWQAAC